MQDQPDELSPEEIPVPGQTDLFAGESAAPPAGTSALYAGISESSAASGFPDLPAPAVSELPQPSVPALQAKLIALLCGIFGLVLSCSMAFSALSADPASCVFSTGILCIYGVCAVGILLLLPRKLGTEYRVAGCFLTLLALFLRLSLFDHISPDYVSFLSVWTDTMRGMTVREALSTPIGDYNMPYLYVILLISRLPFYDLYCIKLFSVLADLACAIAILLLSEEVTDRQPIILIAFTAALLVPTAWLNSAYWGQCDSVYTALGLWGLVLGLRKHPIGSMACFALSLSFKLQAIFLLPIMAFLLVSGRVRWKHLPVFPLVFLAAMVPAMLGGRSLSDTFSIYLNQTQAYPYLSLNAPSFWSMIDNSYFGELSPAPVLIAMTCVLLVFWLFLRKPEKLDARNLLRISLLFCLMIPWLLPRMHERYFYLAEMLSIVLAAANPKELPTTLVLLGGGFLIYSVYLFGGMPILSNALVAAIYGLTIVHLFCSCCRRFYGSRHASFKFQGGTHHGKS